MKLALAIADVADCERQLAEELGAVGGRHKADHDVFHMTHTLAHLARQNLDRLGPQAQRYGVEVDPDEVKTDGDGLLGKARDKTSELLGRRPEPALMLLDDLRELHLLYTEASVDWVLLGQAAQAARDRELLDAVSTCHPQTLRGMKWTLTRLKVAAPQALTS